MRQMLGLTLMLAAFWMALSGQAIPLLLGFGLASVLLVAGLARRMDIVDDEGRPLDLSLRAPLYWTWLAGQILRSAVGIARRIWTPGPAVQPVMRTVSSGGLSELGQVIYANSITLTPGTLSVTVDDRGIGIHALDAELADGLERSAMKAHVRRMVPH